MSLRQLLDVPFGTAVPAVAGDSPAAEHWAGTHGLRYHGIGSEQAAQAGELLVICTRQENYRRLSYWREQFTGARVLWVPFAAFDGGEEAVSYGLAQLAGADLACTRDKQAYVAGFLDCCRHVLVTDAGGSTARIRIPDSAVLAQPPQRPLAPGDFVSAISYFEVGTEYSATGCEPASADGSLGIRGLLCATAASCRSTPDDVAVARGMCAEAAAAGSCVLRLRDGALASFTAGDREMAPLITALAGPRLGARVTEFSAGLNSHLKAPAWHANSPLNEGAAGVHIGVGDGYSGIHFDFICPGAVMEAV